MTAKLWEKMGEGFAEKWLLSIFSPAFVFWIGGLYAYAIYFEVDYEQIQKTFDSLSLFEQLLWVALSLLFIIFSATIVQRLQDKGIQISAGYWPNPLRRFRFFLAARWRTRVEKKQTKWQSLQDALTIVDITEKRRLEAEIFRFPVKSGNFMPTLFGNLLKAAEEYPSVRYGLDTVVCWPRLYLVMPEAARKEISSAREKINENVRLMIWSFLFLVWGFWWPWAFLSISITWIAYRGMVMSAEVYGDLVKATFDLYRFDLYKALGWPLPKKPSDEEVSGREFTEYIFRGLAPKDTEFIVMKDKKDND
jgi:hypothetical protein